MQENSPKPTIEDVAKSCGVSVSTVSRVINKSTPVSKELETKVRKAIKTLGFTPRQWKARETSKTLARTIAIVTPDIMNIFFTEVINGAQQEADRLGMNLVILTATENPKLQKQHLAVLTEQRFDGVIIMGTRLENYLVELYKNYHLPLVVTGRPVPIPEIPCIRADYETAIYQAAKYLISLGHERIAYISGPPAWVSSKARLKGIKRALKEAKLSFPSSLYRWCFPNTEEGFQVGNEVLELTRDQRPTAILAFNDLIAIGVIHAAQNHQVRVPEDLSIIGFDDIALAAHTTPPLTTISQPKYRLGQLSVKKLFELIHGGTTMMGEQILLESPLVLRESAAVCPK